MRLPLLPIIICISISLLIDVFVFRRMRNSSVPRSWCIVHSIVAAFAYIAILWVAVAPKKSISDTDLISIMWVLFAYISLYASKVVYCIIELVRIAFARLSHRPLRGFGIAALAFALLIFATMWWGALFNRFNISVTDIDIHSEAVPEAFQGYRIAQISDLHCGTFGSDTSFVAEVVDRVNAQHPDLIVFTGDIVNRHASELQPFVPVLSRLSAPDGVFSIMGNHDYGDYSSWSSDSAKTADIALLWRLQADMGWHMLNNGHAWLTRGNDSIALIGVENIGDPPFRTYGSLASAYPDVADSHAKILLTHNPSHWVDSIAGNPDANIFLSLAGHTHGMQMSLAGVSPASLRYKVWGGLHCDDSGHFLYVNIGLGTVAMPARIGANPEITIFKFN